MKSDHNGLDGLLEGFGEENRGTGWERTVTACTADGQILIPVAVPGVFPFDRHFVVHALTGRHFAAYLEFDVICLLFSKHLVSSCHCSIRGIQFGFGVLILPFFEGEKTPNFLLRLSICASRDRNAGNCLLGGLAGAFILPWLQFAWHILCTSF